LPVLIQTLVAIGARKSPFICQKTLGKKDNHRTNDKTVPELFTPLKNKRNFLLKLRPVFRWFLSLRSSPRAIAGGLAVGTFIAFTPTEGVQIFLAIIFATLFKVNRAAAIIPTMVTNPVTVGATYAFSYWLGSMIWPGPPLAEVSELFVDITRTMTHLEYWDFKEQLLAGLKMGEEIYIPLFIGSAEVGVISGLLVYVTSLKILSLFFTRRAQRRLLNNRPKR
jgi:uncharacterized protein